MKPESSVYYDASTDSMYVTIQPGRSVDGEIHDDRDFVVDLDENGNPTGYDIQHASQHPDVIAEALGFLRQRHAAE
jgi:uncharacterized protein YuzE